MENVLCGCFVVVFMGEFCQLELRVLDCQPEKCRNLRRNSHCGLTYTCSGFTFYSNTLALNYLVHT